MRMIKVDSNYVIHDLKEGFVHERPSLKTMRDYDVLGIDDNIYTKEDKDEHIRNFYDLSGVLYEFLD